MTVIPPEYENTYNEMIHKNQTRKRAYPQILHHHQHMEKYYSPMLQRGVNSRQAPLDATPYNDSESSRSPVRFA